MNDYNREIHLNATKRQIWIWSERYWLELYDYLKFELQLGHDWGKQHGVNGKQFLDEVKYMLWKIADRWLSHH